MMAVNNSSISRFFLLPSISRWMEYDSRGGPSFTIVMARRDMHVEHTSYMMRSPFTNKLCALCLRTSTPSQIAVMILHIQVQSTREKRLHRRVQCEREGLAYDHPPHRHRNESTQPTTAKKGRKVNAYQYIICVTQPNGWRVTLFLSLAQSTSWSPKHAEAGSDGTAAFGAPWSPQPPPMSSRATFGR